MRSISILIKGKVQGVYFRQSTKETAQQLGITGTVKNQPDGSVYIQACGNEEKLQQFISWCKEGPSRAVVDQVIVEDIRLFSASNFKIVRD
jgi:acylphosphatase